MWKADTWQHADAAEAEKLAHIKSEMSDADKQQVINAAKALGIADTHGSLEVGKVADFAFWDIESPAELSYAFGQNPCVGVVKDGVTVMERAR